MREIRPRSASRATFDGEPRRSAMTDSDLATTLLERIADILLVVADVGAGDYTARLKADDLPPDHPVATLYEGINQMVASLEEEQRKGTEYRRELEEKLAT